ncbi:uncharacterized [Tachysurus ichikawai]
MRCLPPAAYCVFFFLSLPLLSFSLSLGSGSGSGSSTHGVNAKTRGRTRGWTDGEVTRNKCEMQKIWKRRGERRTERNEQKETDEDEEEKQSGEVYTCADGRLVQGDSLSLRMLAAGEQRLG